MKIVADASALLAVLLADDDADQYLSRLLVAPGQTSERFENSRRRGSSNRLHG
jgi:hypothetical protein